jgi:hypothetical protein
VRHDPPAGRSGRDLNPSETEESAQPSDPTAMKTPHDDVAALAVFWLRRPAITIGQTV